ncbi:MAG: hypothetical protein BGN88_12840 [Clostridiales bacterium 43-6]|nr:MAG: hypothetical protein BGN88_12840 [Clostridiales bacterium 43-6]
MDSGYFRLFYGIMDVQRILIRSFFSVNNEIQQPSLLILNLVRNGIEAMNARGKLTITTSLEKNEVILKVRNQGKGIPPHIMEKLGTPFFTTKENGTGLGLTVCRSIVAKHKADLSIDTSINGTIVIVRFKNG